MRIILLLWALPMGLFWGWYFLSLNDISFGFLMLSREVHGAVFDIYGQILGIEPADIPRLLARASIFDTLVVLAILVFRRRRAVREWLLARRGRYLPARNA